MVAPWKVTKRDKSGFGECIGDLASTEDRCVYQERFAQVLGTELQAFALHEALGRKSSRQEVGSRETSYRDPTSRDACAAVFPIASVTLICHNRCTTCPGWYFLPRPMGSPRPVAYCSLAHFKPGIPQVIDYLPRGSDGNAWLREAALLLSAVSYSCGHGANVGYQRGHIRCVHASRRHVAVLHLSAVVTQQIFKRRGGQHRRCASKARRSSGSAQASRAVACLACVVLKDGLTLQCQRTQRYWRSRASRRVVGLRLRRC